MPIELQLAAGNASLGQSLGTASTSILLSQANKLTQTAREFQKAGNFIGQGGKFEEVVSAILRIEKNNTPVTVTVGGITGKVIPDFYWGSKILEVKTSGGAINYEQALKLVQLAQTSGKELVYLFYRKPGKAELDKLERRIVEEFGEDVVLPKINYLFE